MVCPHQMVLPSVRHHYMDMAEMRTPISFLELEKFVVILASFTVTCDQCDTDTGDSQATIEEAISYAERGGWSIYDHVDDYILCDDCLADYLKENEDTADES